ncbi:MAG: biotin/lipoyl-binding protein [Lachnospiraceae bacterium]|nr:biotin/lipoyl-binding protein [Lachnospiraceae bacterium]
MSIGKKIIIAVISIAIVVAVVFIVLHNVKKNSANSKTVNVYAVSEVGNDYYYGDDYNSFGGTVSINMEQKIYPISSQKIKEIYVTEGDVVKAGDVIIEYDTTAQALKLETERTEVELARTAVLVAERELDELKKVIPIEDMPQPTTEEPSTEAPTTEAPATEAPTTEAPATEAPTTEVPTTEAPTTEAPATEAPTTETPPTETPTSEATATDASKQEEPVTEAPATEEPATEAPVTEAPATEAPATEEPVTEAPVTEEPATEAPAAEEPVTEAPQEDWPDNEQDDSGFDDFEDGETLYTREELAKAISDKQNEIKSLNIEYQLKEIEYEIMQYQISNGQVVANFDGVVKSVTDEEEALANNQAMIVISGNSGYTVRSSIGELSLDKVSIGDVVDLFCYDTGMNYSGKITDISMIPTDDSYSYSSLLQTNYPMTITIEDADDLEQGMYMEISLPDTGEVSNSYYLPMPFVKRDNDNYYVMKEVNGELKKVYVEGGKIIWGDTLEIKRGIGYNDYIAFPYASDAVEGTKTKHASIDELYY